MSYSGKICLGLILYSLLVDWSAAQTTAAQASPTRADAETQLNDASYNWLNSLPADSYTLQLGTVYGRERCSSSWKTDKLGPVYCFESSTVAGRYFALNGSYSSRQAAEEAAEGIGLPNAWVRYVPRIQENRCGMSSLDARYRAACGDINPGPVIATGVPDAADGIAVAPSEAQAIKAEVAGDWQRAIAIYQDILQESPQRIDLRRRLSQIYASTDQAQAAQQQLGMVLRQRPDDPGLLADYAKLATWAGDYPAAEQSYEDLVSIAANPDQYLVPLAQVESWMGNTDQSAAHFRDYLSRHTGDAAAYLGYAYTQSWRGDFADALELIEKYKEIKGEDDIYWRARTRFLARAGWADSAVSLADETLQKAPGDYQANLSKTIALSNTWRFSSLLDSLEQTLNCCAAEPSASELKRIVETPLRHSVSALFSYADDSDDVEITNFTLNGSYVIEPDLHLWAGVEELFLRAPTGSGLDAISGKNRVDTRKTWLGIDYGLNDDFWLQVRLGSHDTDATDSTGVYNVGIHYRPSDSLHLTASADRDFHAVSPRALSLDITRNNYSLRSVWSPNLRYTFDVQGSYASFSDSNERGQLQFAVRRSFARTERYNLDLGLSARWTGFDDQLRHGYYDPSNYRQFLLNVLTYIKLSDDNGISIVLSPGIHKDENLDSYELSGNLSIDGTFGIYSDWMLVAHLGLIDNIGINNQSYRRSEAFIGLTRRF